MRGTLERFSDGQSLITAAAERIVTLAHTAITARQRFSIALSGGSTPQPLYQLLATDAFANRIAWEQVYVFWGDERCVPPNHPDSNYRMAREALLDHVPLPAANIYRIYGELKPAEAAAGYDQALHTFFDAEDTPCFDLVLLGMGDDGHTASLFPGTLALYEKTRWVIENHVEKLDTWRITLTPPAINAAAHILFLIEGTKKAQVLREVLYGPAQYPSQLIDPHNGELLWLVDQAAAALLPDQQ